MGGTDVSNVIPLRLIFNGMMQFVQIMWPWPLKSLLCNFCQPNFHKGIAMVPFARTAPLTCAAVFAIAANSLPSSIGALRVGSAPVYMGLHIGQCALRFRGYDVSLL